MRKDACNIFSRNVSAKVSVEHLAMFRRTLPPTFLFLLYAIVKEPTMAKTTVTNIARPLRPDNPATRKPPQKHSTATGNKQPESHHAKPTLKTKINLPVNPETSVTSVTVSLNLPQAPDQPARKQTSQPDYRAHSATASGAPPSLCRYIDPTQQTCQHSKS